MKKILAVAAALSLVACGGTEVIDTDDRAAVAGMSNVMELEYRDWEKTAGRMTDGMLKSGGFAKIKDPVIAIGRITNDTMQRFDTDILTKKIRSTLVNSGRAQISTSLRQKADAEDEMTHDVRNLRSNAEYDQGTIAGKGTLVAPNLSLSGKMLQRNLKIDSGIFSSRDNRVEYYLQMTLTNVKTGLSVWEDEQPIIKEGRNAPTW
jgi:uncharacterized protein (TIGR02722 family)